MKFTKLVASAVLCLSPALSQAAPISIDSYDVSNANTSGYGGWSHTYNGTITSTGSGTANYSNGSGTLNDGSYGTSHLNTQLFRTSDSASIDLFLGSSSALSSISLFSFSNGNTIPGSISGVDVTINGITETFLTIGFGPSGNTHSHANELIDLTGSSLDGLVTNTLTLSNFTTSGQSSYYFAISEIDVEGDIAQVSEPASLALLGLSLAGLGFARRKSKA